MTDLPAAQDIQAAFAAILVDEWLRAGVTHAVVCPGSRSTPLLVALAEAAELGSLRLHVVLDERSAGFFALGLGRALGVPAPVVTTSGTAAVELHPAVVEADHGEVPMLAVTADRPEELHDCGASQTVRQVGLYGRYVRWEAAPGVPDLAAAGSWRSLASRAVAEAGGGAHRPGPVHLNLAFREPLLGSPAALATVPGSTGPGSTGPGSTGPGSGVFGDLDRALRGRAGGAPWHRVAPPGEVTPPARVVELLSGASERGLIVAGRGAGGAGAVSKLYQPGGAEAIWQLARAKGWPVLADPLSGCRWPGAISAADALLRTETVREWRPDIVLRLGAPWSSKVLNEWLGELDCPQVLVDRWGTWQAPDRRPSDVVMASPSAVCREGARAVQTSPAGAWARQWATAEDAAQDAIDAALASYRQITEPATARAVVGYAPSGTTLMVSSSMPLRDVEWWSRPRPELRVVANRGANGIDGVLSAALGTAAAGGPGGGPGRALAVMGDLAFLYDAGALLRAADYGARLDVVVVDNDGGGIFNFLAQAGQPRDRFERLWGTPHGVDLCAVARSYGAEAEAVLDNDGLVKALADPLGGLGVRVLVAKTARAHNVAVHGLLHQAVGAAVGG